MSTHALSLFLYATPLLLIWVAYVRKRNRRHELSLATLEDSHEAGLVDPPSLHPVIDTRKCIGCEACVAACPEMPTHHVLGMVRRKATLISPTDCIGHGACQAACPADAISLVFGTAERGVELPLVDPQFETNVPGIYIAGELGGMGLIANAMNQGQQAIQSIAKRSKERSAEQLDVLIVGAGPAGIAASLAAKEHKLKYRTVEQDSLGGAVAHYPRRKLVMTSPAKLPVIGKFRFKETSKEQLLEFWKEIENKAALSISYGERVESVTRNGAGFGVVTTNGHYVSRTLLLCIGRRGTPRRLDVPGEDLNKVAYTLADPARFQGQRVLVVGGGDSALESALAVAEEPGTTVTLSYRSAAFTRAKKKNRERLATAKDSGRISVLLESQLRSIQPEHVVLELKGKLMKLGNDAVIINAGGILPTQFLRELGIEIETKYGTA